MAEGILKNMVDGLDREHGIGDPKKNAEGAHREHC